MLSTPPSKLGGDPGALAAFQAYGHGGIFSGYGGERFALRANGPIMRETA